MQKKIICALCLILLISTKLAISAEKTIGVTLLSREHVFFNIIEENIQKIAKKYNYEVIVVDANMDVNKQIGQLDDFIIQGVDAVIIAPAATAGLEPAIRKLAKEKIPVVTIDNKINSQNEIIISSIGTDNYGGGNMAGMYIEKYLQGKGNVAVITYAEILGCRERERGFKEAIEKNKNINILDIQNYAGSAEKAQRLVQDMLIKFPELQVIFAVGDPAVVGGIAAAKAAGKNIKFVGFDGNPEAKNAIKQGGMWLADVSQNPELIGTKSVEVLNDYWHGKNIEKNIEIPGYIIDKNNLENK